LIVEIRRASRGMMISTISCPIDAAVTADAGRAGIGGGW
jgi:hypothetical protein